MTRTLSGAQIARAAQAYHDEVQRGLARTRTLLERHGEQRRVAAERSEHALKELVTALLPGFTPELLARAAALTGYVLLASPEFQINIDRERDLLVARLREIDADPRYVNRELLRAPRVGTLPHAIAELEEFRAPLAAVLATAAHPRLTRLLEVGYGTDAYSVPFWRLSYYSDWEAGDQILERFPDKKNFAELREEILSAQGALPEYDRRLAELRAELAAGEALEAERDQRQQELWTLLSKHHGNAQNLLARFLRDVEVTHLAARLQHEPDLLAMAARYHGTVHQLRYLDQLVERELLPLEARLRDQAQKAMRDVVKYNRPKNYTAQFDGAPFEERYQSRADWYDKRFDRYERSYQTIYVYDRYHEVNLLSDFLWWDVMTDGRLDGNFIPEVHHYYESHPHYHYESHHHFYDDHEDAAAAAVAHSNDWDASRAFDAS